MWELTIPLPIRVSMCGCRPVSRGFRSAYDTINMMSILFYDLYITCTGTVALQYSILPMNTINSIILLILIVQYYTVYTIILLIESINTVVV